jgi:signal transduction histidine kinase
MLARIETAFLRVTQFTADASHELRTPVSLMRTEAELALRRSRGGAEYREALEHILSEAERTSSLIEELLALARADSGREGLDLASINLSEALREVVAGWRQVASVRNLRFVTSLPAEDFWVLADERLRSGSSSNTTDPSKSIVRSAKVQSFELNSPLQL